MGPPALAGDLTFAVHLLLLVAISVAKFVDRIELAVVSMTCPVSQNLLASVCMSPYPNASSGMR
jgi:hypothetical protein